MLKFFAPDVHRVAHLPAIGANLPEVDERELNEERARLRAGTEGEAGTRRPLTPAPIRTPQRVPLVSAR